MDPLDALHDARRRYESAQKAAEARRAVRDDAVRAAAAEGHSVSLVARVAGVSRQHVRNITAATQETDQ